LEDINLATRFTQKIIFLQYILAPTCPSSFLLSGSAEELTCKASEVKQIKHVNAVGKI
jgi:hypothetical protein